VIKMKKLVLIGSIMIISFALLFTGCTAPPLADCPEPDSSKITASRGTIGTGGMIIQGAEGAVEPGATVTVTDGDGHTATTTADANGSFTLKESDLPEDFDHTIGNSLSVTQKSEGCKESPAVNVPISP
jgi:plastocyanin